MKNNFWIFLAVVFTGLSMAGCSRDLKLTPTITPVYEGKVCKGKIEASDPVIVRPADIGGNDSSEYSRYAFYPKAVTTSAGILVMWQMGFDGQAPQPNAYMRLLDDNLKPIGDVGLLFKRNWTSQSSSLISRDNGAIFSYCGRYNRDDTITSAFLDSYGHLINEQAWSPIERNCNVGLAQSIPIWTDSHLLFAWTRPGSWPTADTSDVYYAAVDANGSRLFERHLHLDGWGSSPSIAIGHERVLLAVTIENLSQTRLAVYRFDLEGNEIGEPVILAPVSYEMYGQVAVTGLKAVSIIHTPDGWMIFAPSGISGIYVVHLHPDGSPISDPVFVNTEFDFPNGFQDIFPYGDGAAILGQTRDGYVVLFLSGDGIITQQWLAPKKKEPTYGSFFEHQGRLFLVYTSGPIYQDESKSKEPIANQVLIHELKCVP